MQLKCETKTTIDLSHFRFRFVLASFFVLVNEIDLFSFCAIYVFVFINVNCTERNAVEMLNCKLQVTFFDTISSNAIKKAPGCPAYCLACVVGLN